MAARNTSRQRCGDALVARATATKASSDRSCDLSYDLCCEYAEQRVVTLGPCADQSRQLDMTVA